MNTKLSLILITVFIAAVIVFKIVTAPESPPAKPAHNSPTPPAQTSNSIKSLSDNQHNTSFTENTHTQKSEIEPAMKYSEYKSTFNQHCVDILKNLDQKIDSSNISKAQQNKISNAFNTCIYEIDMELALTEKQFIRNSQNMNCINNAYIIRDLLLDLGTDAQNFADMTNNTDSDRVMISEEYFSIKANITTNGEAAMDNRNTFCSNNFTQ